MVWIILLICLSGMLVYIMFAPFYIEIDSATELYRIRFHRLAKASFIFREESVFFHLEVAGWDKEIDLLTKKEFRHKKMKGKKEKLGKKISIQRIKNAVGSFRIKRFLLSIDTGNVKLNGLLFPLFLYFGQITGREIRINFMNENRCILQVQNNMARILWAFVKP